MTNIIERARPGNVTVKLDDNERQSLKTLAAAKRRTPHFLMKEAIQRYIQDEEAEQLAIEAAAASLLHYQQTGLHSTLGEVKAWAKAVAKDRNAPLPECHT